MNSLEYPRKILVVAMLNSIHTARWLSQFADEKMYDVHLFPSMTAPVHPIIAKNHYFTVHCGDLEEVIDKVKPDIIHTLEMQHAAYIVLPIREKRKEFPLWFYSCWGSDIKWFIKFPKDRKKIKKILNYIDAMFCEDSENIRIAKDFFHFNKPILKVPGPGGYEVDKMRKVSNFVLPSKRKIIATKGYTGWVYKPNTVFSALMLCKKEILKGKYEIVIYAPGDVGVYISQLKKIGITVNVFNWTSDYNEILILFSKSRINIAASLSDGIPNSMLEGMVMGAYPIQSKTNKSNSNDFIYGEQNGILVDAIDVKGYAKAIKKTLKDDNLVDNAANNNFYLIKDKIDYDLIKDKIMTFFDSFYNKSSSNIFYYVKKYYWYFLGRDLNKYIKFIFFYIYKIQQKSYKMSVLIKNKTKSVLIRLLCKINPVYRKVAVCKDKIYELTDRVNSLSARNEELFNVVLDNSKKLTDRVNSLSARNEELFENIAIKWKENIELKHNLTELKEIVCSEQNNSFVNLNGEKVKFSEHKKSKLLKFNLTTEEFFIRMKEFIIKSNILVDIGCGIRPQIFFEPSVHICIEPYNKYRKIIKPYFPNRSSVVFLKTDALDGLKRFDDNSVDSVFMFDLIEHLEKEDGFKLIKEADRVARKQIVIFTPLGFYPMFYKKGEKDAWGLNGIDVQEHKSGWTLKDFDKTWDFYICKDCHQAFLPEEKASGKRYSAFMAIKTKKFDGYLEVEGTPDFVKNLYKERVEK